MYSVDLNSTEKAEDDKDFRSKEKELKAKEVELKRREQVIQRLYFQLSLALTDNSWLVVQVTQLSDSGT
ncbi:unnamed protein product [Lactuca virosa]|nr:unnamed protein product [Lactuca virosa]